MWLAKFIAGEIDYMAVSAADFLTLKQKELWGPVHNLRAQPTQPTPSPVHIAFNYDVANEQLMRSFRNTEFRRAMEFLLDRERIIDEVYNGLAIPGAGLVLPANKAFYNPKIEKIMRPYDPANAKAILDKLGLKDKNGDGIREFANGKNVEFTLTVQSTPQDYQDVALVFKEDLEKTGIKVNLQILDSTLVGNMFGAQLRGWNQGVRQPARPGTEEGDMAAGHPAVLLALLCARPRQAGRDSREHA